MEREYLSLHEVEIREVRAKAIDEFTEEFKKANITKRVYEKIFYMIQSGKIEFHDITMDIDDMYCELADEVAEQLKAGGKHESKV